MATYKTIRSTILVALMSVILVSMTACNTTKGVGKDMERGGEKIQDAADRHS